MLLEIKTDGNTVVAVDLDREDPVLFLSEFVENSDGSIYITELDRTFYNWTSFQSWVLEEYIMTDD